ncbi:MAG: glycosyltransferase [Patescibacteria group bacterium]
MATSAKHRQFNNSQRKHILLVTNHGCHSPRITVTTDTGGQNFYVNEYAYALVNLGYKVTIINRGGYRHPVTKSLHKGIIYYDNTWDRGGQHCRLIYLQDGQSRLIPKEKIKKSNLIKESDFFTKLAANISFDLAKIFFINSHYWDGGVLGELIVKTIKKQHRIKTPHLWTPHSLGKLKQANYKKAKLSVIKKLNFPSRIRFEEAVIATVNGVVCTSNQIRQTFKHYQSKPKHYFWFPPGIEAWKYKPRRLNQCADAITLIGKMLAIPRQKIITLIKQGVFFLEISRTSRTKRKDIVLKAFSQMKNIERAWLIMTINREKNTYRQIMDLCRHLPHRDRIVLINKYLPEKTITQLYSLANVYVTASRMEGWGMAVQQAAASNTAIISSKYVPYVNEVLKERAIIVKDHQPINYAETMDRLITEPALRRKMAHLSYRLTTEKYSWRSLSKKFITNMSDKRIIR